MPDATRLRVHRWGPARACRWIRRALWLVLPAALPATAAAQTPAGTEIRAAAEARYETPNGITYRVYSDTLVMVVAQIAGVDLEAPQMREGIPGNTVLFEHTLTNIGNGLDSMLVTATSRRGWPVQLYFVSPGGTAGASAPDAVGGPVPLAPRDTIGILVAVTIPSWETITGPADTVTVAASSQFDPSVTDTVDDLLAIRDAGIIVQLEKRVDRATATVGDILTYTIEYRASGPNAATDFAITDRIPEGTSYVAGTLHWNGTPLTDATGDDAGVFESADNQIVFHIGTINGGDTGRVSFQVRIED